MQSGDVNHNVSCCTNKAYYHAVVESEERSLLDVAAVNMTLSFKKRGK